MAAAAADYGGGSEKDRQGLAMLGFDEAAQKRMLSESVTEVWPENWNAVMLFRELSTQWNVGMRGPVGLRYEAIASVMDLTGIPVSERCGLFAQLRILERGALDALNHGR